MKDKRKEPLSLREVSGINKKKNDRIISVTKAHRQHSDWGQSLTTDVTWNSAHNPQLNGRSRVSQA